MKNFNKRHIIAYSALFLFCFILFFIIASEPKTDINQAETFKEEDNKKTVVEILNEVYNDEFELIEETWYRNGSSDIDFSAPKRYEYTFKAKNIANKIITVIIDEEDLKTPEKWQTDYLPLKYNTQAEEKLTQLLQPIYNDVQVYIEPQCTTLKNMTFEEYFCNYLSDSNISVISKNPHENKNEDLENLLAVLKGNNITIDHIYIYYTDNKMDESWIENGEEAKHAIVYGLAFLENYEIKNIDWHYNNSRVEEKPF